MQNETITINKDQELYVLEFKNGYTCLGFQVCENRKKTLAEELEEPIKQTEPGTIEAYQEYERLVEIARQKNLKTGWRSKSELIKEFIGHEGQRVEIIDNHGEKRRFYIGKSTGFIPCHLEILRSNSTGGGSVTGYPFKKITFLQKTR